MEFALLWRTTGQIANSLLIELPMEVELKSPVNISHVPFYPGLPSAFQVPEIDSL